VDLDDPAVRQRVVASAKVLPQQGALVRRRDACGRPPPYVKVVSFQPANIRVHQTADFRALDGVVKAPIALGGPHGIRLL
jgi:hypothetical protein